MICKGCSEDKVRKFLSLGKLPLGNAFMREDQLGAEELFDLDLGFCDNCTLVQQINPPPQSVLAEDYRNYHYVPYGDTLKNHYGDFGENLVKDLKITKDSFVVDIGSNDGTLLGSIKRTQNCKILGVEPAEQISEMARSAGIPTITGFFSDKISEQIRSEHGYADIISTTQVLQHIPSLNDFIANVSKTLKPKGMYVFEGRYFADTIEKTSFDTVYHEMIHFFTLRSLAYQLQKHNLTPVYARLVDIYGGSLRIYAQKFGGEVGDSIAAINDYENRLALGEFTTYEKFADNVYSMKNQINGFIYDLKSKGKTIAAYGAPSTGTTLMNFCGIGRSQIDYIIDDSPLKQGLFQPGTHIPIFDSAVLDKNTPDYLLIIAWRLKKDILPKLDHLRKKGMKVIIPLPQIEVI